MKAIVFSFALLLIAAFWLAYSYFVDSQRAAVMEDAYLRACFSSRPGDVGFSIIIDGRMVRASSIGEDAFITERGELITINPVISSDRQKQLKEKFSKLQKRTGTGASN